MTITVVGNDGHAAVYDPEARWCWWSLKEIYMGNAAENRYVPKVDDFVKDTQTNKTYRVEALDITTLIPTLVEVKDVPVGEFTDVLLGVGPGTQSDTYRVYLDKSVMPHTLAVDARLTVAGSMAVSCKLFLGNTLDGNSEVISNMYDGSGNLLGNSIPLELVQMPNGQNVAIKTVPVCYTTRDLPDGERVTAVFYSADGHVVSKRQMLIENTAFIRSASLGTKYITGISLKSPFLSQGDAKLIQFPLNVPLQGLALTGVVQYSDGSKLELPVDGSKFSIFGFEHFASTVVGQRFPLVLKYQLSAGEICYANNTVSASKFITESYKAVSMNEDGAFTVKLFGFPVWQDAIYGYRMEWYMYNLDRQAAFLVTPYVSFNANSQAFNGLLYGVNQHLSVSLNLKSVNPSFKDYIHVQAVDVVLLGPGTQRTTNWTIGFDPDQDPAYGVANHALSTFTNSSLSTLNVGLEAPNVDAWLDRIYYGVRPLFDSAAELEPPLPTHFVIKGPSSDVVLPLSAWNQTTTLNFALANSSTVFIKFIKRTADNDIQLAIAALPVYQSN